MGTKVESLKSLPGGWSVVARRCDSCKTAAAAAFCRADSAFLCLSCDTKIHGTDKVVSRHERVWMCEVCEQAPAAVTCKADAAVLCISCDSDIHSANPLARRHERVPIEPFFDSADSIVKSSSFNFLVPNECEADSAAAGGFHHHNHHHHNQNIVDEDDINGDSWLLPTPNPANLNSKISVENTEMKTGGGDLFSFTEMDPFLDIHEFQQNHSTATDRVVPVQTKPLLQPPVPLMPNKNCYDIDFCRSKLSSFNYPCQSISQTVSSSSLDVGVVPDGNSLSDISYPFVRNMSNSDPSVPISAGNANQAAQICGIDREARVLRYREKRRNRKFEKTIRYASRKAYAETRPRIKGRFAKRTEIQSDMSRLYNSAAYMADVHHGVVPSFDRRWLVFNN